MNQHTDLKSTRLDNKIITYLPTLSRSFAAELIKSGKVTVNKMIELKPSHKIMPDDIIDVNYDLQELKNIPQLDLPVIYQDENCIVINKPTGILSHSKGGFNPEATVASWLQSRVMDMDGDRAGIIHRLDRATSGVMICAKNNVTAKYLQKQFADRKVKKTYMAIVEDNLNHESAMIDMSIERNPKSPGTFRVGPNGKSAQTFYRTIKTKHGYSLIELKPTTGRTHQLRVHLSYLKHPIVGDELYDGKKADRLYLHAEQLEITLPGGIRRVFTAKLPSEFASLLNS